MQGPSMRIPYTVGGRPRGADENMSKEIENRMQSKLEEDRNYKRLEPCGLSARNIRVSLSVRGERHINEGLGATMELRSLLCTFHIGILISLFKTADIVYCG